MVSSRIQYPPKCSYEDLNLYTDSFNEENLIGRFQFGKVYRGKIQQGSDGTKVKEVTVKMWGDPVIYQVSDDANECRLKDEITLLQHEKVNYHPTLVKLIGYCRENGEFGVVYDLKPLDTVHNLIPKDNFKWLHRIKVVFGFACLLEFLHAKKSLYLPYLVRNIHAAHIMLDQDHNPKLFDFSMISGGIFPDRRKVIRRYMPSGCYGYFDPRYPLHDEWSQMCDVFSFGVLLLRLITKRVFEARQGHIFEEPVIQSWAKEEYKPKKSMMGFRQSKCSLVHQSLKVELGYLQSDGYKLTKLAMCCVGDDPYNRPTMTQVVECLLMLRVVKHQADNLGIHQFLQYRDANAQKTSRK